jgi:hypothetical protein
MRKVSSGAFDKKLKAALSRILVRFGFYQQE